MDGRSLAVFTVDGGSPETRESLARLLGNSIVAGALPIYAAENDPNHLRALGGLGAAWLH